MIISRTPLRISLAGGGTDMPEFYNRFGGQVISFAIDKYVYVMINSKFDGKFRVSYSQTEIVDSLKDLKHDLIRETLETFLVKGVEVVTVSDIPGEGTGLGSSSALVVGLLKAVSTYVNGRAFYPSSLASEAFIIENKLCRHPVGKQDSLPAAYGGLHSYCFTKGDKVSAEPIILSSKQKKYFQERMLLLWTGRSRSARAILLEQQKEIAHGTVEVKAANKILDIAEEMCVDIKSGNFGRIGFFLDESWKEKKKLASGISDEELDKTYELALKSGATGGKICGAGGGGFWLFWAEPEYHSAIVKATGLSKVNFAIENEGSKIVYG